MEGRYKHGLQDGAFTSYDEQGKKHEEGVYADGFKKGVWREYYATGKVKRESEYQADGSVRWTLYAEDGHKWINAGFWQQQYDGPFTEWYANGNKTAEG